MGGQRLGPALGQPSLLAHVKTSAVWVPYVDDLWILLGFVLGLTASKAVSTTGEGTVVDILLGMVGAVIGGWFFTLLGGGGATGFNIGTVQSAGIAATGAIVVLALYHVFLRRRML